MSLLALPQLRHCRRIFLRDVAVPVQIGIHDFEKQGAQRLLFNVDLFVPLQQTTPQQDSIAEVLDYDFVRAIIHELATRAHINLQETLCDEIAARLLAHPLVVAVRVSTEKPDVYADCAGVGIEVLHFKETT